MTRALTVAKPLLPVSALRHLQLEAICFYQNCTPILAHSSQQNVFRRLQGSLWWTRNFKVLHFHMDWSQATKPPSPFSETWVILAVGLGSSSHPNVLSGKMRWNSSVISPDMLLHSCLLRQGVKLQYHLLRSCPRDGGSSSADGTGDVEMFWTDILSPNMTRGVSGGC